MAYTGSGRGGLGLGFSSPLGNTTSGAIRPSPVVKTPVSTPSKFEEMLDVVNKMHQRNAIPNVPDDFEPGKADINLLTTSMKKLASLPVQDRETLNQIEEAFAAKIKEATPDIGAQPEDKGKTVPDVVVPGVETVGEGSGEIKDEGDEKEEGPMFGSLDELPHPDDLDLPDDVKKRLNFEKLAFQLGFVEPSVLMNCGPRLLKTQLGEVEISVYCQYVIRVLSVYYQNVLLEESDICIFELAHYTHSCSTGKGKLHITKKEDARIRLVGYGMTELVSKLAAVIIPPASLENPDLGLGLSDEYRTLVFKEIHSRYPDFMTVVKITYYTALNDVSILDVFPISMCYNPDYDDYLSLICSGESNLDGVVVSVVPKEVPIKTTKPEKENPSVADSGGVKQDIPAQRENRADNQQQKRPQPVPAFPKPSGKFQEPYVDPRRAKEKSVFDQADLGRAIIKRNSNDFRDEIDDFSMVYQWLRELDLRIKRTEDSITSMAGAIVEIHEKMKAQDENMARMDTVINSRTLAGQQRFSDTILKGPEIPSRGASGSGVKVDASKSAEKSKMTLDELVKAKADLIHQLKIYDKVKDKKALVAEIVGFFAESGRSDFAANVNEKSIDRAMTRSRIIQSIQSL